MNDYEQLAENLNGLANEIEGLWPDDEDLARLLEEARYKIVEAKEIAEARA